MPRTPSKFLPGCSRNQWRGLQATRSWVSTALVQRGFPSRAFGGVGMGRSQSSSMLAIAIMQQLRFSCCRCLCGSGKAITLLPPERHSILRTRDPQLHPQLGVSLCSSMVTGRPSSALLHYERLALCVGRLKAVSPARAQYLIGFAQYAARCVHLRGCSAAQMIAAAVLNFR